MQAAIAGFTPVFVPTDPNLAAGAFESYLNAVEAANGTVSDAEMTMSLAVSARRTGAEGVQDVALRVRDHVGANVAWKACQANVAMAAKLVRGTHVNRKPKAEPPEAPAKKARMGAQSQQGFADIAKNFGKLIAAVKKVPGYSAPAGSGLTVVELEARAAAFGVLNQALTDAEAELGEQQRMRGEYYDGENGLRDKMTAIKKAVRSQYGTSSPEYLAVKGIGLWGRTPNSN